MSGYFGKFCIEHRQGNKRTIAHYSYWVLNGLGLVKITLEMKYNEIQASQPAYYIICIEAEPERTTLHVTSHSLLLVNE